MAEGPRSWTLRYWLCRETTPGGGRTYFLRAHAQSWDPDALYGEELEVVGGLGADPVRVRQLFDQVVAARVFPTHLQDVVRDLTLHWTAEDRLPPAATVRAPRLKVLRGR